MKIAIESNDGKTINSPFSITRGYLICDVEDTGIRDTKHIKRQSRNNVTQNKKLFLGDCCTIITRGMNNENLSELKEKGVDVFVTFNTQAKDAVRAYLKERMINRPLVH